MYNIGTLQISIMMDIVQNRLAARWMVFINRSSTKFRWISHSLSLGPSPDTSLRFQQTSGSFAAAAAVRGGGGGPLFL